MPNQDSNLDRDLQSPAQEQMRRLVRELPEETVNLAWRSQLNQRLMAEAPKKAARWSTWVWRPALTLGLAAFAVTLWVRPTQSPVTPQSPGLEESLANFHEVSQVEAEFGSSLYVTSQRTTAPGVERWSDSTPQLR